MLVKAYILLNNLGCARGSDGLSSAHPPAEPCPRFARGGSRTRGPRASGRPSSPRGTLDSVSPTRPLGLCHGAKLPLVAPAVPQIPRSLAKASLRCGFYLLCDDHCMGWGVWVTTVYADVQSDQCCGTASARAVVHRPKSVVQVRALLGGCRHDRRRVYHTIQIQKFNEY